MAKLYIIATPVGNLKDITFRAIEALKEADLILCEDTRHTLNLLEHYEIKKPLWSYHQHTKINKIENILDLLSQGKTLALVSDAGTPGVSDPGNKLIEQIIQQEPAVQIIPIPGASAVAALASISGFPTDKFTFMGFPPQKNKREKFFIEATSSQYSVIFYESPYRIIKALESIEKLAPDIDVVVGRELTKKFETIYRGKASRIKEALVKEGPRGEFAVIIRGKE